MKKIWIVLALLLALACVFASCDKEETPNTGNNGNTEQGGSQNENNDQESTHTHTYGDWSVSKAATCAAKGEEKRTCACGKSETREIAMLSHTYGEWSVSKAATCGAQGEETRSCTCGASETRVINPDGGHIFTNWIQSLAPTCSTKGEETGTCECGATTTRETATLPHTWGDWITIATATCGAKGAKMHICACGASAAEEIPATGDHTYDTNNKCIRCQTAFVYTEGLGYILNDDEISYTVIAGAAETVANVIIPPYYNGKPVTSIGDSAFFYCTSLTSIEIPASVTSIGDSAFGSCDSLTSVEIPASVTSIGESAFSYCTSLTSIEIPASLTSIGDSAFYYCTSLTSIEIPASVTSIGDWAFYNCTSLTSIEIPASVTSIGSNAFRNCASLTSIEIPASVTYIGNYAFSNCTSLTSIKIPASVTYIGANVVAACSALESITVESGNTSYYSKGNCLIDPAWQCLIAGCKNSIIPTDNSVTSIDYYAFYYCTSLTSIEIPASVTSIDSYAFEGCTSLTSIELPASVTEFGYSAFEGCTSLTSVIFAENSQMTSIGERTFMRCASLASIELPTSVTELGSHVFYECTSLASIELPASVTSIGNDAFFGCTSLMSIELPAGVTSIGSYAFCECTSLTSIEIPTSVTSIGIYAFSNCTSLTSIEIPASVTFIGNEAFIGCSSLESIVVANGNTVYHSAGNCLIETETKTLIVGCQNSVIPADGSVSIIGYAAFQNCSGLTSITIPESVTLIEYYAFADCSNLKSVTFADPNLWWTGNMPIAQSVFADPAEAAERLTLLERIEHGGIFYGYGGYRYQKEHNSVENMTLLFENEYGRLYYDAEQGRVGYEDLQTGNVVMSAPVDRTDLAHIVAQLGSSGVDSYTNSFLLGQSRVTVTENGIRISYAMNAQTPLVPSIIERTAFEEKILKPVREGLIAEYGQENGIWQYNKFAAYFKGLFYTDPNISSAKKEAIGNTYPVTKEKNIDIYVLDINASNKEKLWLAEMILTYTSYTREEMMEDYAMVDYEDLNVYITPEECCVALSFTVDENGLTIDYAELFDEADGSVTTIQKGFFVNGERQTVQVVPYLAGHERPGVTILCD